MAVASNTFDYLLDLNKKSENENQSIKNIGNNSKQLDFYQSMYHFKKMFPKLDSEVIEAILRSNQGSVDKTLDQLLTISVDTEKLQSHEVTVLTLTHNVNTHQSNPIIPDLNDLPPSYNEFMMSKSTSGSETTNTISTTSNIQIPSLNQIRNDDLIDFNSNDLKIQDLNIIKQEPITQSRLNSMVVNESLNQNDQNNSKKSDSNSKSNSKSNSRSINNYFQQKILIGDLSKDFLRIKLTDEQVGKLKSCIKTAKREEIVAILNNVCNFCSLSPYSINLSKKF